MIIYNKNQIICDCCGEKAELRRMPVGGEDLPEGWKSDAVGIIFVDYCPKCIAIKNIIG